MEKQPEVDLWSAHYGTVPPSFAWMLVNAHTAAWTRFCSLPGCKALPSDETELSVAMERFDSVAAYILSSDSTLLLATGYWPTDGVATGIARIGGRSIETPQAWAPLLREHDDTAEGSHFFVAEVAGWKRGLADELVRRILTDTGGRLAIMSVDTGDAVLPYDGGVDTFVWEAGKRTELRERFADWLWRPQSAGD
jgi:hypothetical protein